MNHLAYALLNPVANQATPSQPITYLPNMGRPAANLGVVEPSGVDHLYREPETSLDVCIMVHNLDKDRPVAPQDRHWWICWYINNSRSNPNIPVYRVCEVVEERSRYAKKIGHLTNWGPKTRIAGDQTMHFARPVRIGHLNHNQRMALEQIASQEPVAAPNGWWNCQHWVASVLRKAVDARLFSVEEVNNALQQADWNGSAL